MQVLELPPARHPFYLATQAHPELTSRPLSPQPMFVGLVRAALIYSGVSPDSLPAVGGRGVDRTNSLNVATTKT